MWAPHQYLDPGNKTSRSHYKILSKLTEIYWKWLSMTSSYSVQSNVAIPTHGPHVKIRTLKIKSCVHTIKFYRNWLKFVGDDLLWLAATLCKISVVRPTRRPHVKSWTLELKHHVHTIKFYWNWPKFVRADSVWLAVTLCKAVWLDLHVGPTSRPDSENKISSLHYKILSKLTEIFWRWLSITASYSVQNSVVRSIL